MRKIYLASSWKNKYFEETFIALSKEHDMYNFKNPSPGDYGFNWSEVDSSWSSWNVNNFINRLNSDKAKIGFKHDYDALTWCDTGILLLPSGRSAHLEAGYLIGQGKQVYEIGRASCRERV